MKRVIPQSCPLFLLSLLCSLSPWSKTILVANAQEDTECLSPVVLQECQASLAQKEQHHTATVEEWRHKLNVAVQAVQEERVKDQTNFESTLQDTQSKHQNEISLLTEETNNLKSKHQNEISLLTQERDNLQSALQELQEQLKNQELASSEALNQHGNALRAEFDRSLQEEREKSSQDLEQHKKVLADEHEIAKKAAVDEVKNKHAKELEMKKRFTQKVEEERDQHKSKLRAMDKKYKYQTDELLAARQELLKANEVVRLYNEGFARRWFLKPATKLFMFVYEEIVTPLAIEFYKFAHPVLDPIYEHVVVPAMPYVSPAWELFCNHSQLAFEFLSEQTEIVWEEIVKFWDLLCELAPIYFQQFLKEAWPFVQQATTAALQLGMQISEQVVNNYQEHVAPHVSKMYGEMAPHVEKALADSQKFLLQHWKTFGKELQTQIKTIDKKTKLPTWVLEFSANIAKNPEKTLVQMEFIVAALFGLIILRWVIRALILSSPPAVETKTKPASKVKPAGKHASNGHKKKGHHKSKNGKNAVQFANKSQ